MWLCSMVSYHLKECTRFRNTLLPFVSKSNREDARCQLECLLADPVWAKPNAEFCVPHVDHPAPQPYSSQRSDPENTGSVAGVSTRTDLPTTLKPSADFFESFGVCQIRNQQVLKCCNLKMPCRVLPWLSTPAPEGTSALAFALAMAPQ